MYKKNPPKEMVATNTKYKPKVLSCSTPEQQADSPSRDSDSEAASPVPFLCTQDGNEGETDVVWNFYTPKSENTATSRLRNTTPLSRKSKRSLRPKIIEKQLPKRRAPKISQKKSELFQDLLELNRNLHELIPKQQISLPEKPQSGSEDDIFNETQVNTQYSPKCVPRSSSRCLRKNVLSSNFGRSDPDAALESDDSMNECLLKASQIVEDNILKYEPTPAKQTRQNTKLNYKTEACFKMDQDSMDAILNSIRIESPVVSKVKKCDSPGMNNDSFDNFVEHLNDSALEQLTQMPIKANVPKTQSKKWTVKELIVHNGSPSSKSLFGRHSSMPESPSLPDNKPSTSGMAFGRYSSMPFDNHEDNNGTGDSPIRCTQDEIKKKHQLARERLQAKRLLPFTSSPQSQSLTTQHNQPIMPKNVQFKPKIASNNVPIINTSNHDTRSNSTNKNLNNTVDLKLLIEKKRQEALMKLRRRQPQNK